MPDLAERRFSSDNGRFNVTITVLALKAMLTTSTQAGRRETGGILIGRLVNGGDTALVKEATGRPKGSTLGWFSFVRGTWGLAKLLRDRWNRGEHYLGEWHFHPGA